MKQAAASKALHYNKIIIGAGLYGLYAALYCAGRGERILVLEYDEAPFMRATYVNQARVHMGYHYPRSLTTAVKSAAYFERFVSDYSFCVNYDFEQIYALSSQFSWTDGRQFSAFCEAAGIFCEEVPVRRYFKDNVCETAYLTREYTYDAALLKDWFWDQLKDHPQVDFVFRARIKKIAANDGQWYVYSENGDVCRAGFILNATYASVNQLLQKIESPSANTFPIKYELCEIILVKPADILRKIGITVMDGPFFSIMPFGKTGLHSLTSVTFTPHLTSQAHLPSFSCQQKADCDPAQLGNCDLCQRRPASAWPYISNLAGKYLRDDYRFAYEKSLFSMKPILKSSEIDDSRPTVIKKLPENPPFISVLSGKINTLYDLDEYL